LRGGVADDALSASMAPLCAAASGNQDLHLGEQITHSRRENLIQMVNSDESAPE